MNDESFAVVKSSNSISVLGSLGIFMAGLAALIVAGSVAGFVVYYFSPANKAPVNETPQSDFQVVQLGQFRRDQFLLDRRSGRIWTAVCSGKASGADCEGMLIWAEMYVDNVTPSDSAAAGAYRAYLSERAVQKKTKP